jgi:hypothetical protein
LNAITRNWTRSILPLPRSSHQRLEARRADRQQSDDFARIYFDGLAATIFVSMDDAR